MATYGIDAVRRLVDESDLEYPFTVEALLREYALTNVDIDPKGNSVMLGELVDASGVREFASEEDLERKLGPAIDRLREERNPGIVGRLVRIFT